MPGPAPQYRPDFPADFVAQAQRLVRQRTISYQLHQRAHLVLLLQEHSLLSNVAAAAQVGLHPNSVRHWRQRWAQGDFALEDAPGRGGQPAFSPLGARPDQGNSV
jgi:transposase-like protein